MIDNLAAGTVQIKTLWKHVFNFETWLILRLVAIVYQNTSYFCKGLFLTPDLLSPTRVLVFSALFPNEKTPNAGLFIRERMFRVAKNVPLVVVAPQVWSPFDWLLRFRWKTYRLQAPVFEVMDGIEVYRPRVLSIPMIFKSFDGWLMAKGSYRVCKKLVLNFKPTVIDAHFCYPAGYAASILAQRLNLPLVITLRGSADNRLLGTALESRLRLALTNSNKVIAVSNALKQNFASKLGLHDSKVEVIGNGVDLAKFSTVDQLTAREKLGFSAADKVIISVGNLIQLKGFHRLIALLPRLIIQFPTLKLLVVGGPVEGDSTAEKLKEQVQSLGLGRVVYFAGRIAPDQMKWYYGCADIFALATAFEGWANVFLEAMACGLPVITTQVGGNAEVVSGPNLGSLIEFWNEESALSALTRALSCTWDIDAIKDYARANSWEYRVKQVEKLLHSASSQSGFR